ncbi:Endoribonuclease Dicer homolog 1-like protein [Drosera capensis]
MELEVEQTAKSSFRKSKWQFMGARDAGAKEELRQVYGVSERSESDGAANLIQKLRATNYALSEFGQWCAYKSLSFVSSLAGTAKGAVPGNDTRNGQEGFDLPRESAKMDEIEEGELPDCQVVSGGEHVDEIIGAAVADGKVTPKVQSLIKILMNYQHTEDFRAIIFVERVVSALVLPKVTLLVATSVAEEGLDFRQCNVVIRFDLAETVLAYIQSRGRARKPGSDYILMVERGNLSQETFLRNARNSEEILRIETIERTDVSHLKGTTSLLSVDISPGSIYQVEATGAIVSLNSAVGLVHFYCSQLPSDRYSILRPEFIMVRHEKPGGPNEYSCKLQLPCNAPFEKLEDPVCSSMRLAQQAVCLAACKKLHEMGAITDMLLPDRGSGVVGDETEHSDEGDHFQELLGIENSTLKA